MRNMKRIVSACCAFLLMLTLFIPSETQSVYADDDDLIVVSFGDSYSSGEGITPFYGQEDIHNSDWIAHRSENSWPGKLVFPGRAEMDGKNHISLKNYHSEYGDKPSSQCKWYFAASSGATTSHFYNKQEKTIQQIGINNSLEYSAFLSPQLDVFNDINQRVDYVTLTIGGNDVHFSSIIQNCVTGSSYLRFGEKKNKKLHAQIDELNNNMNGTLDDINKVYRNIADAAPYAEIIVAGYPELLNKDGKGVEISRDEAETVNSNVKKFNNELGNLVEMLQNDGIHIHFVDVAEEFDGHQAYSKDAWINPVMYGTRSKDLKVIDLKSAYSVHPNNEGAEAYARCVNRKIEKLERAVTGKVRDLNTGEFLEGVTVQVLDENGLPPKDEMGSIYYIEEKSLPNGSFTVIVPEKSQTYRLRFEKEGYIPREIDNISVAHKEDIGLVTLEKESVTGTTINDSWEKIIASVNDGTYKNKYHIGDTKSLDLGSEGIIDMQIAAFNADELADGSGTAAITWIAKHLLNSWHRMNPYRVSIPNTTSCEIGTGNIGGWEHSEMRAWLNSDIKPLIPTTVRNAIKPVTKYSATKTASLGCEQNAETTDEVWIPSYREVFGLSGAYTIAYESNGPIYSDLFIYDSDRGKNKVGVPGNSSWWLRSSSAYEYGYDFQGVDVRCVEGGWGAPGETGVVLCFCM